MEYLIWILKNLTLPIIVSLVTVFANTYLIKKRERPTLILMFSKLNLAKNIIYKSSRISNTIEEEFKEYLLSNNCYSTQGIENLLRETLFMYRSKIYLTNKIYADDDKNKICELINNFKNEEKFIKILKKYEAYLDNSNWNFKLLNVGKSKAYNVKIKIGKEIISKGYLEIDKSIKFNLNFFDSKIRMNLFDLGCDLKFQVGFSRYYNSDFYLIEKRKYNKKDEIVFEISYVDSYNKNFIYYCCFKEEKSSTYNDKNY